MAFAVYSGAAADSCVYFVFDFFLSLVLAAAVDFAGFVFSACFLAPFTEPPRGRFVEICDATYSSTSVLSSRMSDPLAGNSTV